MSDPTGQQPDLRRAVSLHRTALRRYQVTNVRGGTMELGDGTDGTFTPVEAFLAALAACSSFDVDQVTSRRSEPLRFEVVASGDKTTVAGGNAMANLRLTFDLEFPDGPDGDRARERIAASLAATHDRLCTVSRTIELGTPVTIELGPSQ